MPYDRIIRADLYLSDRWLSLPSDTHRLVYNAVIHVADDFGNFEGGSRRLWRWMHSFSQVKTEQDAIKLMADLADQDLVRRYEIDGKELWHIPRFKNTRRYTSRKCPRSPWCELKSLSTVEKLRKENKDDTREPAADLPQASGKPAADLLRGVGVGVGVGVGEKHKPSSPSDDDLPANFVLFWRAYPKKVKKQESLKVWRKLKPHESLVQVILNSLAAQKRSEGWAKENGRFIPHPPSWLKGRLWEDELVTVDGYGKFDEESHV